MKVLVVVLFFFSLSACSCVCGGGSGVAPGSKGTPSNSLMHSVIKLASGVAPDNSPVQRLAFSLLANLAMSRDCRGLLQKVQAWYTCASLALSLSKISSSLTQCWLRKCSLNWGAALNDLFTWKLSFLFCHSQNNFLQAFLSVPMPKAGSVKATSIGCGGGGGGGGLLGLWLRLLVSLSSAEDGQQSILRVTGALELLADLAQHRHNALLTLHNLCFCPANKPHVIANGMKGKQELDLLISRRDMNVLKQRSTKKQICFWIYQLHHQLSVSCETKRVAKLCGAECCHNFFFYFASGKTIDHSWS